MNIRFFSFLIFLGPSFLAIVDGSTLRNAIDARDFEMVKDLIAQGADVNEEYAASKKGFTCSEPFWGWYKDQVECSLNRTPLAVACRNIMCECSHCLEQNEEYFKNQLDIIEILICSGAQITFEAAASCLFNEKQDLYILDTIIDLKQSWVLQSIITPEMLEIEDTGLRENLYREKMRDSKFISNIVQKAFECEAHIITNSLPSLNAKTRIFYVMSLLVKYGFDLNTRHSQTGCTLLHLAAERSMLPDFVIALLALGAKPAPSILVNVNFPHFSIKRNLKPTSLLACGDDSLWQQNVFSIAFIKSKQWELFLRKIIPLKRVPNITKNIMLYSSYWFDLVVDLFRSDYRPEPYYLQPLHRGK